MDSIADDIIIEFSEDRFTILDDCETKKDLILLPPLIELYFIALERKLLSSFDSNKLL
jgi:hypothetical protein